MRELRRFEKGGIYMDKIIGFIGAGNMAKAIIGGIINSKLVLPDKVFVSNPTYGKLKDLENIYKVKITNKNIEVAKSSDILFLSVKPNKYPEVIEEIKDQVKEDVIVVTIAAGKDIESTQQEFGKKVKVLRAMPNTPALVGEGMTALMPSKEITEEEFIEVKYIFESFGKTEVIDESLIHAFTSMSGSSPAYVFMFIEALADGGVLQGIPRDKAYKFAAQAVLGSAKMVLETGIHPGQLKDMVCSPAGTTIEAVEALEETGFRHSVMSAVKKCSEKSVRMSK